MSDDIRYEVRGRVAIVRLNRPDKLNAFTYDMLAAFRDRIDEAVRDSAVTAIVVTGTGRAFCAGIDVSLLEQSVIEGRESEGRDHIRDGDLPALFSFLLRVPKPVIAAVNGVAAGGGFVLAMMCDMRVVADDAYLATIFSRRGLIAEHAMSWILPRQIGTSRALDLLWSSRKVGAREALAIGLADRISNPEALLDDVAAYVEELAASVSPRAMAVIKRQVYAHWSAALREASIECEWQMNEALAHSDAEEGARSFVERREPRFGSLEVRLP
ncbi:MAG: enoyl-CoA hydratase-related protein [Sphingopyxis granuli]